MSTGDGLSRSLLDDCNGNESPSRRRPKVPTPSLLGVQQPYHTDVLVDQSVAPPPSSLVAEEIAHDGGTLQVISRARTNSEFDRELEAEREHDIRLAVENIAKLNEIFTDVAKLVADQQETIDDLENGVRPKTPRYSLPK